MTTHRVPTDLDAYERRTRGGRCFICELVAGTPGSEHEIVYDDGEHLAFLNRYPTLYGYTLVAPHRHVELIHRELDRSAYLRLQDVVYRVARALAEVVPCERMYVLSLGSQQGNSHIHWHVAPLPPGTPYREQQYHALMAEHGIIPWDRREAAELGARLRAALDGAALDGGALEGAALEGATLDGGAENGTVADSAAESRAAPVSGVSGQPPTR